MARGRPPRAATASLKHLTTSCPATQQRRAVDWTYWRDVDETGKCETNSTATSVWRIGNEATQTACAVTRPPTFWLGAANLREEFQWRSIFCLLTCS
jgi:hypothetical protein